MKDLANALDDALSIVHLTGTPMTNPEQWDAYESAKATLLAWRNVR